MPRFDDELDTTREQNREHIKQAMDALAQVNPDEVTDAVDALLGKAREKMQQALKRL